MKHLKKATKRTVAVLAAALGLGAGLPAAAASLTTSASDELQLRSSDRVIEARLRGNDVVGSDIQLTRYGADLRGRAFRAPVNLNSQAGLVTGTIGTRPVRLQLDRTGQGLNARGLFNGQTTDLRVGPMAISGRIGRCSYDLRNVGDHYEGSRQCGMGRSVAPATLQIPQQVASMDDSQAAALLGVLLSR